MQIQMWAVTYRQRPTFFLHPDVQGIVSEDHAARIGADVMGLDSTDDITAIKVDID